MSAETVIKEIERIDKEEREKIISHIIDNYLNKDAIHLGNNYNWWNKEKDDL